MNNTSKARLILNHETGVKLALSIGSAGAIRTETLRAYSEDEYRQIIAALP